MLCLSLLFHSVVRCGLLVGCLTSQQHASVSQGRICSDNLTCCHTEIEAADQTFYLTQSQYTDTGPIRPSTDPIMPGRVATGVPIFKWYDSTPEKSRGKRVSNPVSSALERGRLNHLANEAVLRCGRKGRQPTNPKRTSHAIFSTSRQLRTAN